MPQTERLYRLKNWFDSGRCLSRAFLLDEFGISFATLKRDLAHLRDRMNAPIVFDRERGGWRLDAAQGLPGDQYELPGLWLSADEIRALLTMQHLLANLDSGGLLGPHIAPLIDRLNKLLGSGSVSSPELARRIKVQTVGARQVHLPHFQVVGGALLQRRRLEIDYHGRGRNVMRTREVSPQRLIHYRDNWYLDAWCHWRRALRSFSVDAIQRVLALDKPAIDVPERELDDALGSGYGIFAGRKVEWAKLRFAPDRAKWVAAETWHPNQRGRFDEDGCWNLELPYADSRELAMDILRHVPDVEVLAPAALRDDIRERLERGLTRLARAHAMSPAIGIMGPPASRE